MTMPTDVLTSDLAIKEAPRRLPRARASGNATVWQ
jgi:hypothetical protein